MRIRTNAFDDATYERLPDGAVQLRIELAPGASNPLEQYPSVSWALVGACDGPDDPHLVFKHVADGEIAVVHMRVQIELPFLTLAKLVHNRNA